MIFVVDTNILFSACYTPSGRIFDILFNAPTSTQLISAHYAIEELMLHKGKFATKSSYTAEEIDSLIASVLKQVDFINEEIIDEPYWLEADRLTKDVDSKDIAFVALTLQTGGLLWTGDKKLANHLKVMSFDRVVNTTELIDLLGIG